MNMIMAIETRRKPVFSYSSFFLLRSFLLVIAKTKGTTKKKEIIERHEMNTHSPKELDSVSPIRTNIMAIPDSTALILAVILIIASIKTEIARNSRITTKG